MRKILLGFLFINTMFFTAEAFAKGECLTDYDHVPLIPSQNTAGAKQYACIFTLPEQFNNVCPPLFGYKSLGFNAEGYGCKLKKKYTERMCNPKEGVHLSGHSMTFKLKQSLYNRFSDADKDKYRKGFKNNASIIYICDVSE